MTDHNHPLTETAAAELWDTHVGDTVPWDDWYGGSRRALTALLRAAFDAGSVHATNNLRDTPAGRALMAEAWEEGVADNERGWQHVYAGHDIDPDDPLAICQTCCTPNPYRGGDA